MSTFLCRSFASNITKHRTFDNKLFNPQPLYKTLTLLSIVNPFPLQRVRQFSFRLGHDFIRFSEKRRMVTSQTLLTLWRSR